jgi:DNA invertase Pin-like site-specific DNA recombinase
MDIKNTLQYLGYCRKSSEDNKERQAASLEEQLYILEGIRSKYNLTVISILQESKSAHKPGRAIFISMLDRVAKGEANGILVWHPNRLARNMSEGGRVIDLMDEGKLLEIRTPSRIYYNTPEDKFMLTLEFGISKKDSDDKALAVHRGLEKKLRDGWRPGVAPEGYLNDRATESGFRKILVDSERFSYIKKIFELFHAGTAVVEIHRIAKEDWHYKTRQKKRLGGKSLTISMIYWILTNPFYMGKYEYPKGGGNWHEGRHEKVVSEEVFNEIQVMLGRKSKYQLKHNNYAYSSLIPCGHCGSTVCAQEKWQIICMNCKTKFSSKNKDRCPKCQVIIENMKNPTRLHYIYYACGKKRKVEFKCTEGSLRNDRLEDQVKEKLERIEISSVFTDWAIRQIEKMDKGEKQFEQEKLETIKRERESGKKKLANLLQLKISPTNSDGSLLSDGEYKTQKESIEAEIKAINKQLGEGEEREKEADIKTKKALTFAALAMQRFNENDPKIKRDIFRGLAGLNLNLLGGIVNFDSPKYIYTIEEMKKEVDEIEKRVEPRDWLANKTKMEAYYASIPSVLRG